jgi:hypothetical protein
MHGTSNAIVQAISDRKEQKTEFDFFKIRLLVLYKIFLCRVYDTRYLCILY